MITIRFLIQAAKIADRQAAHLDHLEQMRRRRNQHMSRWAMKQRSATSGARQAAEDQALIRRADQLAEARATAEGELAQILAEQERDERFGHKVWRHPGMLSLDAPDRYGRPLYEVIADTL